MYALRSYATTGGQFASLQVGAVTVTGSIAMASGAVLKLDPSTSLTNCPVQWSGDPNSGLSYVSADSAALVFGGVATIGSNATAVSLNVASTVAGSSALTVTGALNANTYVYTPLVYVPESSAPAALADASILHSLDSATKTALKTKQGAAGTVVQLAIEI